MFHSHIPFTIQVNKNVLATCFFFLCVCNMKLNFLFVLLERIQSNIHFRDNKHFHTKKNERKENFFLFVCAVSIAIYSSYVCVWHWNNEINKIFVCICCCLDCRRLNLYTILCSILVYITTFYVYSHDMKQAKSKIKNKMKTRLILHTSYIQWYISENSRN